MNLFILGCGSIGSRRARLLAEDGHRVFCSDTNPDRAAALAAAVNGAAVTASPKAFASVAAVFVCTWPDSHLEWARHAIFAGVPTFIEKPLGLSLDGWDALAEEAEHRRVKTMVACNWRFAADRARKGSDLGARFVRLEVVPSPASQRVDRRLDVGWHTYDLARYLGAGTRYTAGWVSRLEDERREIEWDNGNVTQFVGPFDQMYRDEMQHFLTTEVPMNGLREAIETLRALLTPRTTDEDASFASMDGR